MGRFHDVDGGTGNDVLSGEQGYTENIFGGAGDDYLYGPTDSQLNGSFGNDIFCAQSGATPYLFSGGEGSANYTDKGCGPAHVKTDMDSVGGPQCPSICQIL